MSKPIQEIITALKNARLRTNCPNCNRPIELAKTKLFSTANMPSEVIQLIEQKQVQIEEQIKGVQQETEAFVARQTFGARSVNRGLLVERIVPLLPGFRFDKGDCRSLFDPIDYIIFDGLNKTGRVKKIYFAEVKSGSATVSPKQSLIARRIAEKKVRFIEY